jgi:hypothetical protein
MSDVLADGWIYTKPIRAQDLPWIKAAGHGCVIGSLENAGYRAAAVRLK